jgi:Tfp pilus assembly protein PilO
MSRLLPFIVIIFAALLMFLYIRPTYSGPIHEKREQIRSYDDALAAAERFQQKEAELTQARAQIPAESLARLNDFLPDGVDNVQLILDLNALAARSGVTLSDFDTQNASDGGSAAASSAAATPNPSALPGETLDTSNLVSSSPIDSVNLTFKGTGTYTSFRGFLSGMETSLRPIDVENIEVADAESGVYTYTVTVRIYWLR